MSWETNNKTRDIGKKLLFVQQNIFFFVQKKKERLLVKSQSLRIRNDRNQCSLFDSCLMTMHIGEMLASRGIESDHDPHCSQTLWMKFSRCSFCAPRPVDFFRVEAVKSTKVFDVPPYGGALENIICLFKQHVVLLL